MLEQYANRLKDLAAHCKDAKERERLRALYALSIGKPPKLVCEIFAVHEDTLREWTEKWEEEQCVKDKPRPGRPSFLNEDEKQQIRHLVDENNPSKHGFNASSWDCKLLMLYFAKKGKVVSIECVRRSIVSMGGHYVKAVLQYPEADEQQRIEFAKELLKEEKEANVVIFFEDEMSAETTARAGYGWTFDERLVIIAPQRKRKRLNYFGAVNPYSGETIEIASASAKAPSFIRLLRKIYNTHSRELVRLYIDSARPHKSKLVKRFLERHSNIQVHYMPFYSPELNPREHWHNHVRQKLLNNQSYKGALSLARALHSFTKNTPLEVIKSVCTLKPIYSLLA